jgi:leucyl aminopeptidase
MFESVKFERAQQSPVVVLGVFKEVAEGMAQHSALLSGPAIVAALLRREWTGDAGNIVEAFPASNSGVERVLLVGLGKTDALNGEKMRDIAAKVGRRLAQIKEPVVGLELASALHAAGQNDAQITAYGRCWGESLGLLSWKARQMQGSASKHSASRDGSANSATDEGASDKNGAEEFALAVSVSDEAFATGLEFGLKLAASANLARTLSQTPPNIATPLYMAEQAQQMAQEAGLECRVIQGVELELERLAGLINVGKASVNPPCLIRLEYRPENTPQGASEAAPLVLLGKTITYDTGGLTLKVNNGMVGMKRDKDGGCAVLGAMHAVATLLKPDFPVVGLLVAAENMVSDAAFRPDDVLTYRNGVTVEVTNTDAEGRLVLADGLCWACDNETPRAIVDLATLTGGVVTALGSTYAGYFCEDERLRGQLEQASAQSGERLWRLPLHQEYRDMLKSPVADIINSNPNRKAHPIQGAAFLSYFVTKGTPWAHIDIAGVHAVDGDSGPFVKGPTGYGVRLLADLVAAQETLG